MQILPRRELLSSRLCRERLGPVEVIVISDGSFDDRLHLVVIEAAKRVDVLMLPSAVSSSIMAVMDSSSGASITATTSYWPIVQ